MSGTSQLELWDETEAEGKEEISLKDMDAALLVLRGNKLEYERVKKLSDEANAKYREQQATIVAMLEKSGKKTYICEGTGRATLKTKLSVKTPKTPEDKEAFFAWIETNMGTEAMLAYTSINSRTLQTFYKEQMEEAALRGETLQIDGLEEPTSYTELSFTKA